MSPSMMKEPEETTKPTTTNSQNAKKGQQSHGHNQNHSSGSSSSNNNNNNKNNIPSNNIIPPMPSMESISQTFCEEGSSYFNGEWVTNTVNEAVSHFFGREEEDGDGKNGDVGADADENDGMNEKIANKMNENSGGGDNDNNQGRDRGISALHTCCRGDNNVDISSTSSMNPDNSNKFEINRQKQTQIQDPTIGGENDHSENSLDAELSALHLENAAGSLIEVCGSLSTAPTPSLLQDHGPQTDTTIKTPRNVSTPTTSANATNENRPQSIVATTTFDTSLELLRRSRSLSPTFSIFSTSGSSSNNNANSTESRHSNNRIVYSNYSSYYKPYFLPQDFTTQTWTSTIEQHASYTPSLPKALGATGAAVLTAAIIIHPLGFIGAVGAATAAATSASAVGAAATAATAATAVWAVGKFNNLDGRYQIWGAEEFGRLFWQDPPRMLMGGICQDEDVMEEGEEAWDGRSDVAFLTSESSREMMDSIKEAVEEDAVEVMTVGKRCGDKTGAKKVAPKKVPKPVGVVKLNNEQLLERPHADTPEGNSQMKTKLEGEEGIKSDASPQDGMLDQHLTQQPQSRHHEKQSLLRLQSTADQNLLRRIRSAPVKPESKAQLGAKSTNAHLDLPLRQEPATHSPQPNNAIPSQALLKRHYPPLEIEVVSQVEFPGLHTAEFFRVFFANDAPYSMMDFQKKRGDVDIVYGEWNEVNLAEINGKCSFRDGKFEPLHLSRNSVQERTLTFNTLTKSYFGPAYAKATKTQRAAQLSNHLLVIENKTCLADIPYGDRFQVVERWIIEAVRNDGRNNDNIDADMALYTSKLSVHAEVVMLKSCTFETQIRKKASETFTEMVTDWCKTARVALQATAEHKQKRLKLSPHIDVASDATTNTLLVPSPSAQESELFAKHRRNFQELDKLIAKGDLEWCSIEVLHSSEAGKQSAFAQVLEFSDDGRFDSDRHNEATNRPNTTALTGTGVAAEDGKRKAEQRKSIIKRNLFRKLSSKVSRGSGKSK